MIAALPLSVSAAGEYVPGNPRWSGYQNQVQWGRPAGAASGDSFEYEAQLLLGDDVVESKAVEIDTYLFFTNDVVTRPQEEYTIRVRARWIMIVGDPDGQYMVADVGEAEPPHEHSYTQKHDAAQHWQECSCGERLNVANHIQKKDNHTSVYQHYRNCCNALKVPDVARALDQMMVLDYLIVNEDRHFNNFGLLRNPDTLEWLGSAPIYDSGSSLDYDKLTPQIRSGRNIICKPFKKTHQDQLRLVTSFDWLDLSKLDGVDQDIREVFAGAEEFIDKERVEAIIASVNQRIQMLETFVLTQQPQEDSTENDVERNVAAEYGMKM